MRVGIATDHGGFELNTQLLEELRGLGHEVVDFGAVEDNKGDNYPDFVIPLALDLGRSYLGDRCKGKPCFLRRLDKVAGLERTGHQ